MEVAAKISLFVRVLAPRPPPAAREAVRGLRVDRAQLRLEQRVRDDQRLDGRDHVAAAPTRTKRKFRWRPESFFPIPKPSLEGRGVRILSSETRKWMCSQVVLASLWT